MGRAHLDVEADELRVHLEPEDVSREGEPALEGRLLAHALEGEGEHGDEQVEEEDDREEDEEEVQHDEEHEVEVLPAAEFGRCYYGAEVHIELRPEEGELHGTRQGAVPFIELRHEADGLEALGARVDEVERAVESEDEVCEEGEELEDVIDEDLADGEHEDVERLVRRVAQPGDAHHAADSAESEQRPQRVQSLDVSNVAVLVDGVGVLGVDGPGTPLELSPRDRPGVNLGEDGAGRLHVVEGDGARE
mmetsp:Transcript_34786/g.83003  ORF Transcript_34786/g.83003 Transcript_34786/m.83003 type:complete len:249 (-) Transcript_34786:426-1172(-)